MMWIAVAAGGAIGSLLRYGLGLLANQPGWPWGTWLANGIGCFLIGLFYIWGKDKWPEATFLLLTTGLLGGFTMFSAFTLECVQFLLQGDAGKAALYIGASVLTGLLAAYAGLWVGRLL